MSVVDGKHRKQPDEVTFGRPGPPRFRLPGWLTPWRAGVLLAVAVCLAVVAAWVSGLGQAGHRDVSIPRSAGGSPAVIDTGRRLLGVRAGWQLFAMGPNVLLRIRLAAGVITSTPVPALASSGPVSFVVGPRQAVIRPLDFVPGYLVPDGQPARTLPATLGRAGPVLPGPGAGQLWVQTGFGTSSVMSLVTYAGRSAGVSVTLPSYQANLAVPDGRGYFLVSDGKTVYDVRPGLRRRVASGTLDAAGPTAWLVTSCPAGRCRYEVIDPVSGARRLVPGQADLPATDTQPGMISPDGRFAAIVRFGSGHPALVHLINLRTGEDRVLSPTVSAPASAGLLAWSPDSRWLFTVTARGSLAAIDPATGLSQSLGVRLPFLTQLTVRAGG
jgi:hypothetical protein